MMPKKRIVIVDYNLGNIYSVQQAFIAIGQNPILSNNIEDIISADALVLPGVGAFGDAMKNIHDLKIFEPIIQFVKSGKPFLGVCLGMQLLFEESNEFGLHKGFNFIKGSIKKFPALNLAGLKLKVPQIAWNTIYKKDESAWVNTPLSEIKNNEYMYFVHSYYAIPSDIDDVLTLTKYDEIEYCSAVKKNNIFAMQFHPEKSGNEGLKVYKNWVENI